MASPPARTRPRIPLSRERILRAAVDLADARGLEALTMRELGESLGVQAMSLYRHVADKEDLLDAMVDLVVAEIEVPSQADPWKVAMRRRAISAHDALLRHPWACALLMSRAAVGPAKLRYVDATLGSLHGAGFSWPMADHAWNALDAHIYGFTLQELNFPFKPEQYADVAAGYLPTLSATLFPSLHALTTLVVARQHSGLHDFTFGLDLLLDGLERLLDDAAS
jgi:AcrR family transcriptional regulator